LKQEHNCGSVTVFDTRDLYYQKNYLSPLLNKGNNKITEHRAIFQRERQNS
jgi:hypothetical protein